MRHDYKTAQEKQVRAEEEQTTAARTKQHEVHASMETGTQYHRVH